MEKKKGTPEYQIKDIVVKKEAGEVQICWKSKEGTHFLVCIYNNNTNSDIQLKEVLDTLKKAGMKDSMHQGTEKRSFILNLMVSVKYIVLERKNLSRMEKNAFCPMGFLIKAYPI